LAEDIESWPNVEVACCGEGDGIYREWFAWDRIERDGGSQC